MYDAGFFERLSDQLFLQRAGEAHEGPVVKLRRLQYPRFACALFARDQRADRRECPQDVSAIDLLAAAER